MERKIQDGDIIIPLSKIKMVLLFLGALLFVVLGFWLIFGSFESHSGSYSRYSYVKEPAIRIPVGVLSIVFFGLIGIFVFIKLFDSKPGLIINEKGIIDNSSGISVGLVLWSEIEEILIVENSKQKFIMLVLNNPQNYLSKIKNRFKRKATELNYKMYGAPISISANTLQIKFKDLHSLLTKKIEEFKE